MNNNDEKKKKGYNKYVNSIEPMTKWYPFIIWAFLFGGLICVLGQGIGDIAKLIWPSLSEKHVSAISSSVLIFLSALLTGIGVWDKIALFGGAGAIVPITGFSNAIASASMEYRKEGLVFGTTAKMFNIAGPVIVNGVGVALIIGTIYFAFGL